tara:strand:+ start:386 stop:595 length:210 start_codon:yes stop_codon:yes gene_type:complete
MDSKNPREKLKIVEAIDNKDGTTTLNFEIDEHFVKWFNEEYDLDKFCNEKFAEFVNNLLLTKEKNITEI